MDTNILECESDLRISLLTTSSLELIGYAENLIAFCPINTVMFPLSKGNSDAPKEMKIKCFSLLYLLSCPKISRESDWIPIKNAKNFDQYHKKLFLEPLNISITFAVKLKRLLTVRPNISFVWVENENFWSFHYLLDLQKCLWKGLPGICRLVYF